jgi:hypothetical protein
MTERQDSDPTDGDKPQGEVAAIDRKIAAVCELRDERIRWLEQQRLPSVYDQILAGESGVFEPFSTLPASETSSGAPA